MAGDSSKIFLPCVYRNPLYQVISVDFPLLVGKPCLGCHLCPCSEILLGQFIGLMIAIPGVHAVIARVHAVVNSLKLLQINVALHILMKPFLCPDLLQVPTAFNASVKKTAEKIKEVKPAISLTGGFYCFSGSLQFFFCPIFANAALLHYIYCFRREI